MSKSDHSHTILIQAERERLWEAEYRHFEAARELRRARLRGVLRLARRSLRRSRGNAAAGQALAFSSREPFSIPVGLVVGAIDEVTGRRIHLLPSGRRIAQAWHRVFTSDHDGTLPSLEVIEAKGGWYLSGGKASLVQLEVLRAKGHRFLRAVRSTQEEAAPCRGCQPAFGTKPRSLSLS